MEHGLLSQLVIIFGLSILVLIACHRFNVPAIVGLLLTGLFAGPNGLGIINARHDIEIIAELGVILLMFTIGVEFSFSQLWRIRKLVLLGGSVQVGLTVLAGVAVSQLIGLPLPVAVLVGFIVSLSSTALVLKLLRERGEIDAPSGRLAFSILVFQDVAVVPMMLVIPLLARAGDINALSILMELGRAVLILLVAYAAASRIVPFILEKVAYLKDREIFLVATVVICLACAFLTNAAGLSLAIGALLAGLIISESEYKHQALSNVLPFQQTFVSLFFITIGMLLDLNVVLENPLTVFGLTALVIAGKTALVVPTTWVTNLPFRISLHAGLMLAQVGEFSFILAREGLRQGILTQDVYQICLAVSVITLIVAPLVITRAPRLSRRVAETVGAGQEAQPVVPESEAPQPEPELYNHVLIIGFGFNGRVVAEAAEAAQIPYTAVEMNLERVREAQAAGHSVSFGDATQPEILHEKKVDHARVIVVAISDRQATRRIVSLVRSLNSRATLIVRTRYLSEVEELHQLGASDVVAEEVEAAIEIFHTILAEAFVPEEEAQARLENIRAGDYNMLRSSMRRRKRTLNQLPINENDAEVFTLRVSAESKYANKPLSSLDIRQSYGATILGIKRDGETLVNPNGDTLLLPNDLVMILAQPGDEDRLRAGFSAS